MSDTEKGNLAIKDRHTNYPQLMQQLDAGTIGNVIGHMLSDLGLAVANTNRAGELTIKMKLAPGNSADNSHLNFNTELKIKEPKMDKGFKQEDSHFGSIVFVGKGGKLTYDRPKEDLNGQKDLLGSEQAVRMVEDREAGKVRKV